MHYKTKYRIILEHESEVELRKLVEEHKAKLLEVYFKDLKNKIKKVERMMPFAFLKKELTFKNETGTL